MKIICIGRNYLEHAKELDNPVPEQPVVFMKPATALLVNNKPFYYPEFSEEIHHEVEVVLRICKNGRHIQPQFAHTYFDAVALGIDFTARDLQQRCKQKGHPWEIAKAFDDSAVVSPFVPVEEVNLEDIRFALLKDGVRVQEGSTAQMIFSFAEILVYVSKFFRLTVGDYIFTGTPAGVGPIRIGNVLVGRMETRGGWREMFRCEIK